MFVSVIIPTHNRRDWVTRAVASLLAQDYPADRYEVIVCCDRCTDGTEGALRTAFRDRVRIAASAAPGQTGALNTGLRLAHGELAVFLDDEMEAESGFISAHVGAHRAQTAHEIAVTGYSPVVIKSDSTPLARELARSYEEYHSNLAQPGQRSTPLDLNGGNFSVRVGALREIGGFNESYFFQRNDFELAVRLIERGYKFLFCQEARAQMHVAITPEVTIGRAAVRAKNDHRLVQEHPWCLPYLPFYRVLTNPSVRRRWRVLWETGRPVAGLFRIARKVFPESLRLANLEYAARYCAGLRQEIGSWPKFCRLSRQKLERPI